MIQKKPSFDACNVSNQIKMMKENHKKNGNNDVTANSEAENSIFGPRIGNNNNFKVA